MVTFEMAINENQPIEITQFDRKLISKGYFTNARIDRATVPDGWYVYDLREGDDGDFACIESEVFVNHGGTVALQDELTLVDGRLILMDFEETNSDIAQADYSFC